MNSTLTQIDSAFRRLAKCGVTGCLVLFFLPAIVNAEDESVASQPEPAAQEKTISLGPLGSSAKLSAEELDGQRAKEMLELHKVTINDQDLNGNVSGNSVINTNTGDNILTDSAFSGSSGFVSTIQNSGNNVLIQNSTIVNVEISN